jgi:hypothetical protein
MTLDDVLQEVRDNLTGGKGNARHGGVEDGDWNEVVRHHGLGFLSGQAHKKLLEGLRFNNRKEIVGAVGYLLLYLIGADRTRQDDAGS